MMPSFTALNMSVVVFASVLVRFVAVCYTTSQGLTYDICSSSGDCRGSRRCATLPLPVSKVCTENSMHICLCQPISFQNCNSSFDCGYGEACRVTADGHQICTSCTAPLAIVPIISMDDAETCVKEPKQRYSFERCSDHDQCVDPRKCYKDDRSFRPCEHSERCVCKAPRTNYCSSSRDCLNGDRCAKRKASKTREAICVSCRLATDRGRYVNVDHGESCDLAKGPPTRTPVATSNPAQTVGSTAAPSPASSPRGSPLPSRSSVAHSTSESTEGVRPTSTPSPTESSSSLSATPTSSTTVTVEDHEASFTPSASEDSQRYTTPSVSPSLNPDETTPLYSFPPSPETSSSPVIGGTGGFSCIAAYHLCDLQRSELVYKNHRRTGVLCDAHNNCATPGHMVVYENHSMMMISYCQSAKLGCVWRIAFVNSPIMKRTLRIESHSPQLQFTAYAATLASSLEERLLRSIIGIGL